MTNCCPACGKEAFLHFRARDLNCRISRETFHYHRCSSCALVFLAPIPVDLGSYYRDDYIAYTVPSSVEQLAAQAEKVRFRMELVQKFVSGGRLLEIGPSYGGFAFLAKQAGFDVEAIEMDATCCRFLTSVVGVKAVHSSDVNAALTTLGDYNVIALWHVVEHLSDPWATLDLLANRLLPGSILVISTPNPDSWQFKIFGRFWVHVDAPRHLALIPAPLLTRFLRARGLNPLLSTTTDEDGLTLNRFGWCQSFRNFFSFKLIRYPMGLVGRTVGQLVKPLERTAWRGSAYTIVFQREA